VSGSPPPHRDRNPTPCRGSALPFFLGFIRDEFTFGGVFGFTGVLFPDTAGYQTYP
jgi:hypothetical protein